MIDLKNLTITKAQNLFQRGELTSRELTQAYLDKIGEKNAELNAYVEVFNDALAQADQADLKLKNGLATAMTGIPIALKDNILFSGHIASAGSKILKDYKASYDSTVVRKLKDAGAVILGRTNMDEFAMGSSTQISFYGPTKNPHDISRVAGGSSGGSAAALAADLALTALGTETCGSVREPAAFCGLVGLKPTYGAVSRHGILAMGTSLDQVSPFGKSVADAEIVFRAINGYDPNDSTSVPDHFRTHAGSKPNFRIGVPWHLFNQGVDSEVMENFKASITKLQNSGCEIVDLELPMSRYSLAAYYIIMPAEVSTNLARFDGMRYGFVQNNASTLLDVYKKSRGEGFGLEARRRILLGTYVLSHGYYDAYYNKAVKVRGKITEEIKTAFQQVDLIVTPTAPIVAFKLGEKLDDPVAMYLCDIFSAPANLSGTPSLALPSGTNRDGLPLSIQFLAPHWREDWLFEIGKKFEKIR